MRNTQPISTALKRREITIASATRLILVAILGLMSLCSLLMTATRAEAAEISPSTVTIYVAPHGDDRAAGTRARPLATVNGAREMIRALKAKSNGKLWKPVRVVLESGVYNIAEPIVFRPEDSGTKASPITYEGNLDSPPVLSGGMNVVGWKPDNRRDGVWTVRIPEIYRLGQRFSSIWVNGQRRYRAKSPNAGFYLTVGQLPQDSVKDGFRYAPRDIVRWPDIGQAIVVAYHSWESSMHRIREVDEASRSVTFTQPSKWAFENWERGQRYSVENVEAAFDSPGEWYFDENTGILAYRPLPEEDMTRVETIIPILNSIIRLEGDTHFGEYVTHVHFRGLRFSHTDYDAVDEGSPDWQASISVPAAIEATGAKECTVRRCELAHLGTHGIWFRQGCSYNRIEHNEIHDMSGGGIYIGSTVAPAHGQEECAYNVVSNNLIHDGTKQFHGSVGIWIGKSSHNRLSHNEICDLDYTGVSVGWTWGYAPSDANNNIVEYNHIHHLGRGLMSDLGGIYTLGVSPGTVLRHNLIHDVYCYEKGYGGWGIYTDEGSSAILIAENIVYKTTSSGFHQHYGEDNTVVNNIFAFGRDGQLQRTRMEPHNSFTFERNIVVARGQPMLAGNWSDGRYVVSSNTYWDYVGEPLFEDMSFSQWQSLGRDVNSQVRDPLFAAPYNGDFTLTGAVGPGFVPIDTSKAGLFGEEGWVAKPRLIPRVEYVPAATPSSQEPLYDGFEGALEGATPRVGTAMEDPPYGTVRVSRETAAEGIHSLKFFESPGCKNSWDPHMYYTTRFKEGLLRASFWLMCEAETSMYHEWRDSKSPYRVGPSFEVTKQGRLRSQGKTLLQMKPGVWHKIEITCGLGLQADGSYNIAITPAGGDPVEYRELRFRSRDFRELNWLGWVSDGTTFGTFYIDDVSVRY